MRIPVFAALAVALVTMTGCVTTDIDTAIRQNLPQICSAGETAHTAFTAVAETGQLSVRTVDREARAYAVLETLCADPDNANVATVLVTAAAAYAQITQAMREAERSSP